MNGKDKETVLRLLEKTPLSARAIKMILNRKRSIFCRYTSISFYFAMMDLENEVELYYNIDYKPPRPMFRLRQSLISDAE